MRRAECATRLGSNARRQKIINVYHSNEIAVSRQQAHESDQMPGPHGPRPIPTHLKVLRGNPGKQRLNREEPEPMLPPAPPEAPEYLTSYARAEWERIVTELYRLKLLTV